MNLRLNFKLFWKALFYDKWCRTILEIFDKSLDLCNKVPLPVPNALKGDGAKACPDL